MYTQRYAGSRFDRFPHRWYISDFEEAADGCATVECYVANTNGTHEKLLFFAYLAVPEDEYDDMAVLDVDNVVDVLHFVGTEGGFIDVGPNDCDGVYLTVSARSNGAGVGITVSVSTSLLAVAYMDGTYENAEKWWGTCRECSQPHDPQRDCAEVAEVMEEPHHEYQCDIFADLRCENFQRVPYGHRMP